MIHDHRLLQFIGHIWRDFIIEHFEKVIKLIFEGGTQIDFTRDWETETRNLNNV